MLGVAVCVGAIALCYWEAIGSYLRDQHYQTHFIYLWLFCALTFARTLKGPFHTRFSLDEARDRRAIASAVAAAALLWIGSRVGSSTLTRTSLVIALTGFAVLAVRRWSAARCVAHGLLIQMCFGVPYTVFQPLSSKLQLGIAWIVAVPARLGLADYTVTSNRVRFPHYELTITADCSGLGQLLTFAGIAALGVLSSRGNKKRALGVFALAVALAWISNTCRVALFVLLVGLGATQSVNSPWLHATIGFLVYMPFVIVLVAVILRTHRPVEFAAPQIARGRYSALWVLAPLLAAHFAGTRSADVPNPEPPFFSALLSPPGHELKGHGRTEAADKASYSTPWLINARFGKADGRYFDLFYYSTSSNSHLCVHKVSACLGSNQATILQPIDIDGHRWWRVAIENDPTAPFHAYFAFIIGGERHDDSLSTQWLAIRRRLLLDDWQVQLVRVVFPGKVPDEPDDDTKAVLRWLDGLTDAQK